MAKGVILAQPELDVVTIRDFTPGVINGSHNGPIYSSEQPPGSASSAFRCYARQGIGLKPLPTYSTLSTKTFASGTGAGMLTMGGMRAFTTSIGGGVSLQFQNVLMANWSKYSASGAGGFDIDQVSDPAGTITNLYTHAGGPGFPGATNYWPNIAKGFWTQSSPLVGGFCLDPTLSSTAIAAPDPAGLVAAAILPISGWSFASAFFNGRMTFFVGQPVAGFGGAFPTVINSIFTSDIQADTNIVGSEFIYPDISSPIGTWGSISNGEVLLIYRNGGAVVVNGDIQNPSGLTTLPGVTGCGAASGPATPTPIGLVYPTEYDGAWVWNGGNTSQKFSNQIQDSQLIRTTPGLAGSLRPIWNTVHSDCWINWIFFANNWIFDCSTNAWWQCEDPAVQNFQVFAACQGFTEFFYASPGTAFVNAGGGNLSVPIMKFDHATPASSYQWVSNPISSPGALSMLRTIEICASNPTSTSCTIVVTPTSPPNQVLYPNSNQSQPMTFTIPANTAAWRGSLTCGYTDYNVCVKVVASNSNPANSAPILHELSCAIDRRPSTVS